LDELKQLAYFGPLAKQIEEVVMPALQKEVYPLMEGLGDLIGVQLEHLKLLDRVEKSYFEPKSEKGLPSLSRDIETVRAACKNIDAGIQKQSALRDAQHAADQALNLALLRDSTLANILRSLTCMTVNSIMLSLGDSLRGFIPDSAVESEETIYGDDSGRGGETPVLCPQVFITQFSTLVKGNLKKHVLDAGFPKSQVRLSLSAGFVSLGNKDYVVFRVSNTGPDIDATASPRFRSRMFNRKLELVDGYFVPAVRTGNEFCAAATMRLRVFGGKAS
jgi:hypothetical protein